MDSGHPPTPDRSPRAARYPACAPGCRADAGAGLHKPECLTKLCETCNGRGEVYAEAPWARWFTCGICNGHGYV